MQVRGQWPFAIDIELVHLVFAASAKFLIFSWSVIVFWKVD